MQLFSGIALFSPSVPLATKDIWVAHGGIVAETQKERQLSQWFFCNDIADPCIVKFSTRPVIVFHANWILASANSSHPLPLAKYVLDERFTKLHPQNISFQHNQGSLYTGISRELSEINAQIDNPGSSYSVATRLTTASGGRNFRKRPHAVSPEHPYEYEDEEQSIKKLKRRSLEDSESPTTVLGLSGARVVSLLQAPAALSASAEASLTLTNGVSNDLVSSAASLPFCQPVYTSETVEEPSSRELTTSESIIVFEWETDHDRPHLCEKLVNNGQVRNEMGHTAESLDSKQGSTSRFTLENPVGPDGVPEGSCASRDHLGNSSMTSAEDIWMSLMQKATCPFTYDGADIKDIPTMRVSDALLALKKFDSKYYSLYSNEDVMLFVKGCVHNGRKFDVDKGDRRRTI